MIACETQLWGLSLLWLYKQLLDEDIKNKVEVGGYNPNRDLDYSGYHKNRI